MYLCNMLMNFFFRKFVRYSFIQSYTILNTYCSNNDTYHSFLNFLSFSTLDTICAPWIGGFEYIGLIKILICDITLACSSLSEHTIVKAPALSPTTYHQHNNLHYLPINKCYCTIIVWYQTLVIQA